MRVAVFGMGYVGVVSAACLTRAGHSVTGIDPDARKIELLKSGIPPVIENGLEPLIAEATRSGSLRASVDPNASRDADLSLVCVGTPSQPNGSLTTTFLTRVCNQIGDVLRNQSDYHVVAIRSTALPGTTTELLIPAIEASSHKRAGRDFGVCFNPEFMREGSAVEDFTQPARTVIGELDRRSGDRLAGLYDSVDAPEFRVPIPVAEMAKYADNSWHGLKIAYANEIGRVAKAMGIDSHQVMDLFCEDTKLNLSRAYLRPGQAFGGSCIPKDLRALTYRARQRDVETPVLHSILQSNRRQSEHALRMVLDTNNRRIGVLGLSFKAGTDDLRESPVVDMIEQLIGKGLDVCVYDRTVQLAGLLGANRDYIYDRVPHISKLMVDSIHNVLEHGQTIVIGNSDPEFDNLHDLLRPDQVVVDLVRSIDGRIAKSEYHGICW